MILLSTWEYLKDETNMCVCEGGEYEDVDLVRVYDSSDETKTAIWAYEARYIKYWNEVYSEPNQYGTY